MTDTHDLQSSDRKIAVYLLKTSMVYSFFIHFSSTLYDEHIQTVSYYNKEHRGLFGQQKKLYCVFIKTWQMSGLQNRWTYLHDKRNFRDIKCILLE